MIAKDNKFEFDRVKWVAIFAVLAIGLVLNYKFSEIASALRFALWIVFICVMLLIAFWTTQGKRAFAFLQEARLEMRKVHWPTRQETVQTTLLVMAVVAVVALILWGVDSAFMSIVGWITGQRG